MQRIINIVGMVVVVMMPTHLDLYAVEIITNVMQEAKDASNTGRI